MKLRHSAALALMSLYQMIPPPKTTGGLAIGLVSCVIGRLPTVSTLPKSARIVGDR
jgi:hypothetical protein